MSSTICRERSARMLTPPIIVEIRLAYGHLSPCRTRWQSDSWLEAVLTPFGSATPFFLQIQCSGYFWCSCYLQIFSRRALLACYDSPTNYHRLHVQFSIICTLQ